MTTATTQDESNGIEAATPRKRDSIEQYAMDGEAVLFDPMTREMYLLNHVALSVWQRCDGRRSVRRIVNDLIETYEVTRKTALEHIGQLLSLFATAGLLARGGDV